MLTLRIPDHVHHRFAGDGVVILNTRTGRWHMLNETAGELWQDWERGVGFEEAVAGVAGQYPEISPVMIRDDANHLLRDLVRRGIVEIMPPQGRPAAPTTSAPPPRSAVPVHHRFLAAVCLTVAYLALRLPFHITCALVTLLKRCRRTDVSADRARSLVTAVAAVGFRFPGRASCLETSLAAVLLAALFRRRLDWCLGALTNPCRFHAWVEVGGQPIGAELQADSDAGHLRVLSL